MIVIVGIVVARRQRAVPLDQNLVAIAPFDVVDADLKLWHEGMVDVLSRNLDGAGPLHTVSPTLVVRRWTGRADKESARLLGRSTGARLAVFGRLIKSGTDSVRASASLVDVGSGQVLGDVERRDGLSHMDRLSDSLTVALLRELGKTRALRFAQISSVGTTSLTALKAFLQAQQFFRQSAWDSAVTYYDKAVASDSTFAIAMTQDGAARGWVGGAADSSAVALLTRAARYTHGLSPRDSMMVVGGAQFAKLGSTSDIVQLADQKALFATAHEAVRRYPNDPETRFLLGDAQFHWGWGAQTGIPESEVVRTFDKAIALDSAFTPAYIHAIEMAFRYGTANGRRYLAAYLSHNPTDVDAEGMRLLARLADPKLANTVETRTMLDTASADQLQHAASASVEWGDSAETNVRLARLIASGRKANFAGFGDSLTRERRLAFALSLRGHAKEALTVHRSAETLLGASMAGEIPAAQADSAVLALLMKGQTCGPCAISLWGMMGDTMPIKVVMHVADSMMKLSHSPVEVHEIGYSVDLARTYLTLARRDTAGAIRQFAALPDSSCHSCGWGWITQAVLLSSQGHNAEAAAILDEVGMLNSSLGVYVELERGRIAEKLGDKARARDAYAFVGDMWQNGDPYFKRISSAARERLKHLSDDNSATKIPIRKP